jgi:glycosyltransferase involved in cell wall biosynthesis
MRISLFTSWQVRCGIAAYTAQLVDGLQQLSDTSVDVVPYDRQVHPRADYVRWGQAMNAGDVAHVQHEYSFFGYRLPWRNQFGSFAAQIQRPLVITRHVTFDGPLMVPGHGPGHWLRRFKWSLYNKWLGPYARQLNKDTFDRADQIIVLSARLKDHLVARGVAAQKIHLIPAGVPHVDVPHGGEALRAAWGWADKEVLGLFGYITPAKGHALLLEALAQLPDRFVLLIAGGLRRDADRAVLLDLEQRLQQLHLQQRVRITGYLAEADVPPHIDACSLLVYPATHVDSSYSLITGLAYQHAPIIASDAFGHREVAERQAGITLFRSGEAGDLARVIQTVSAATDRRAALLEEARRYARDYAWPVIAQRTREVYTLAQETHAARRS